MELSADYYWFGTVGLIGSAATKYTGHIGTAPEKGLDLIAVLITCLGIVENCEGSIIIKPRYNIGKLWYIGTAPVGFLRQFRKVR